MVMSPDIVRLGSSDTRTRPRIKVVGVGGAGCNIVSDSSYDAIAVCKSEESGMPVHIEKKCVLTRDHIRLFKTTSPQMFTTIGGTLKSGLFSAIGEADLMFLFTGLGGETGSSVTPALANIARKHCKLVVVSAAMPFSVEGGERRHFANASMDRVMEHSDIVISYQNDSLLKIAPNLPLRKAFTAMDMIMMAPVVEIASTLTVEDLVQVRSDFSSCKHVRCGIGLCGGIDRELRAVSEAFTSPWFDFDLANVKTALVISSSEDPDGNTAEKIAKDVAFRVPNARVRYASRQDKELNGKVRVVVLLGFGPRKP
jgi:cell division protein FtsZ